MNLVDITRKAAEEINKRSKKEGNEEGKVVILSSPAALANIDCWLPTGILSIDRALGIGLPAGRMVELYGDYATGKTLLAMHLIKSAQEREYPCAVFDTEHAFSPTFAKQIGVDIDAVLYSSPNTVEEVFEGIERMIEVTSELYPDKPLLVIWDSVAQTSTQKELENSVGAAEMGLRARLIGQGCRKITGLISKKKVFLLFVNQIRESLDSFGPSYFKPGGKQISFFSTISIQIKSSKDILDEMEKRKIGRYGEIYITKSRVFPPFKKASFESYFDRGIDPLSGFVDWLTDEEGVVTKSGGWCYYKRKDGKEYKFRAKDVKKFILDNPEILREHESWILEKIKKGER
jgi:recombination protein RecA